MQSDNNGKHKFNMFESMIETGEMQIQLIHEQKNEHEIEYVQIKEKIEKQDSFYKKFIEYQITVKFKKNIMSTTIGRRYSEILALNDYIRKNPDYYGVIFPNFPEKHNLYNYSVNFLNQKEAIAFQIQRQNDLEEYLQQLIKIDILSNDHIFYLFLSDPSKEYEIQILKFTEKIQQEYSLNWILQQPPLQELFNFTSLYLKTHSKKNYLPSSSDQEFQEVNYIYLIQTQLNIFQDLSTLDQQFQQLNELKQIISDMITYVQEIENQQMASKKCLQELNDNKIFKTPIKEQETSFIKPMNKIKHLMILLNIQIEQRFDVEQLTSFKLIKILQKIESANHPYGILIRNIQEKTKIIQQQQSLNMDDSNQEQLQVDLLNINQTIQKTIKNLKLSLQRLKILLSKDIMSAINHFTDKVEQHQEKINSSWQQQQHNFLL